MGQLEATAVVRWRGFGGTVEGASGLLRAATATQAELGGPGTGTNPEELMAAAHANWSGLAPEPGSTRIRARRCAGPEGAVAEFGADDAFPITDLDDILPGLLERSDRVYYSLGAHEFDQRLLAFIQTLNSKRQSGHAPRELVALDHLLHEMRLFKSSEEVAAMKKAAAITGEAHLGAMRLAKPGRYEYEIEALLPNIHTPLELHGPNA